MFLGFKKNVIQFKQKSTFEHKIRLVERNKYEDC